MNTRIPSFLSRPVALAAAALATALLAAGPAQAAHGVAATAGQTDAAPSARPLPVVASFSILADLVKQVGGDRVAVESLVKAGGDTHVFQPGPAQVRQLSSASLVVVNGLGFEGWMPRLIGSSGYKGPVVEAARGLQAMKATDDHHHHGDDADEDDHDHEGPHGHDHDHDGPHGHDHDEDGPHGHSHADHDHDEASHGHHHHHHGGLDPHAWQDALNVRHYVANIAEGLCQAAPADCDGFRERARAYDQKLLALDQEIHQAVDATPTDRRRVMVSHAAFGYYGRAYHITFMAPVGVSTEEEPSASVVATLIRQARQQNVQAFFFENNSDPRLLKRMASELKHVTIGELYADSLSPANGPAADYLSMMRYNTRVITQALSKK